MKGCWVVVVALVILGVVGPAWTKPAPKLGDYSDLARQITAVMNLSADPCRDFYDYACGGWQSAFKLPADKSRFSLATDTVDTNNKNILRAVLESSPSPPLIGPFYQSCMDMASRNALHLSPILTRLYAIQRIGDLNELFQTIGELHVLAVQSVMANIYVDADPQNPQRNLLHVMQGGVALDSPDDLSDPQLMPAYSAYVRQLFKLLDEPDEMAERHSQWAIEFEKRLANISLSPTDLRDPYTTYHLSSLRDLYATTPAIPAQAWVSYFKGAQLLDYLPHTGSALDESAQFLNIATPTFFQGLSDILAQYLKDESGWDKLRAYLTYELVNSVADHLSDPFVEAHFNFFGRTYTGQQENKPLWERCISITDGLLGDELGKYYVNKTFSTKAKAMAVDLVKRIEDAFLENLNTCEWIDEPTRKLAAQKLNMIGNKIGFPDHWMDYSSLQFDTGKYMENTFAASSFLIRRKFSQLPKPVDKSKWDMTPPTVNAYYDPSRNEMVFPAGILQSPWFFSETYPAVINFGGIGNAMGHELTHGFDDTGSLFDGNGVLHQWWPEEVRKKFDERTKCVSDLYSTYSPLPGVFVDGQLTLGENVADMGGVHEAFTAYRKYAATAKDDQVVPGLTNEQLFFVSYALSWCEVDTDEAIKRQVKSNPHSPVRYRVNGPLSQYQGFADTFKCPVGSQMNPPTKCTVW